MTAKALIAAGFILLFVGVVESIAQLGYGYLGSVLLIAQAGFMTTVARTIKQLPAAFPNTR